MTSGNNKYRETGNDKRHINLTVDDVPDGTISNPIESSNYPKSYKSSDTDAPPNIHPLNAMTTSVRNRADNCTNILQLEEQNNKGGLGRSPLTRKQTKHNKQVLQHILNVLLDGNNNTQIGIAIKESAPTLPVLLEYIRTPGLIIGLRWKDKDDGNKEKMLTKEQYEDLLALYSFLNYNQNWYGPIEDGLFNILETTREQFDLFIWMTFRAYKPILYNQDEALKSQLRRSGHQNSIGSRNNTDTTPVCDCRDDIWFNYFYPINRGIATTHGTYMRHATEFYILSSHELYWNEITIWPPQLQHEDEMSLYMKRVLSGQLSTIYVNNPEPDDGNNNDAPSDVKDRGEGSINSGLSGTENEGGSSSSVVPTPKGDKNIDSSKNGINSDKGGDIHGRLSSTSGEGSGVSSTKGDMNINSSDNGDIEAKSLGGGKASTSSSRDTTTGIDNNSGNTSSAKNDPDLDVIRKAKRTHGKMNRRSLSRQFTGSGRRYHEAVPKMQPSVIIIQRYARMFLARKKVRSLRVGSSRRGRCNGRTVGSHGGRTVEACTPATSLSSRYTLIGTRRTPAQATGLSQPSLHIKLLSKKNGGENGEMAYVQDTSSTSANTSANVFAISVYNQENQGPSLPKIFRIWGEEELNAKFYIRLDGEYARKVEVDLGAWGEYDDNPINVMDWQPIMIKVRKFSDRMSVWNQLGRHHLLQREHRINLGSIASACSNIDLNDLSDTTSRYTTRDDNYMVGINSKALYRQYNTLISGGSNTNKDHFDALVIDSKGVRGWGAINVGQVDRLYSVKTTTLSCMASCLYLASCLYWNDNEKELMALALVNGQEISCPDYSCDGDNSHANFENNTMPQCTRYISDTSNGNTSSPNVESNDIGISTPMSINGSTSSGYESIGLDLGSDDAYKYASGIRIEHGPLACHTLSVVTPSIYDDINSVSNRLSDYGEPTLCSIMNACLIIESNSTDDTAPTGNRLPSYGEHSLDNTGYDIPAVTDRAGDSILYGLSTNITCLDECNNEFAISDNTMAVDTVKSDIGNKDIDMEVSISISGDNIDTTIAITPCTFNDPMNDYVTLDSTIDTNEQSSIGPYKEQDNGVITIGIGIVSYTNDLNCETFDWEMTEMTYLQVQRRSLSTLQWKLIPKVCIIILNDNDRGVTTKKQNKHPICKGVPIVKVGIFVLLRDDSETVVSPRLHQQIMSLL